VDLNFQLITRFLETVIWVEMWGVDCDVISAFVLKGKGDVDDQLFGATDT
jgi:hypothetical protein